MPNLWFRFYSEFAHDPKVQMLSEAMQRRLVMLFCEHCEDVTIEERHRMFAWRLTEAELVETKQVFLTAGFIDEEWNLTNWHKRQFLSDSSTDRTRRYRERHRTSQERHIVTDVTNGDALEQNRTEQNRTEKTQKQKKRTLTPFELPSWIDSKVWEAFEEMRKRKRAPLTDHARDLLVKELIALEAKGHKAEDVINKSITNSWSGFFEPKNGGNNETGKHSTRGASGNLDALQEFLATGN